MLSTPPATITSAAPVWTSRAAVIAACMPEPQRRLTVWPGTSTGRPASSSAMRATFRLSSPAWLAQPSTTSSTSSGRTPARPTACLMTSAARSSGRTSFSWPPKRPIGVRAVATITASRSSAIGLPPLEPRLPLLQERGRPLADVLGGHLHTLEEELEVHRLLQRRVHRVVDRPLDGAQRLRRPGGEPLGQVPHEGLQLVGREHPVVQAQPRRLVRA